MACGMVLASARPPRSMMPFYTLLDLDTPMINYNGALVLRPARRADPHAPADPGEDSRPRSWQWPGLYPEMLVSAEILDRWYTDRVDEAYMTETARIFQPDMVAPDRPVADEARDQTPAAGRAGAADGGSAHASAGVPAPGVDGADGQLPASDHARDGLQGAGPPRGGGRTGRGPRAGDGHRRQRQRRRHAQWAGIGVAMANAPRRRWPPPITSPTTTTPTAWPRPSTNHRPRPPGREERMAG